MERPGILAILQIFGKRVEKYVIRYNYKALRLVYLVSEVYISIILKIDARSQMNLKPIVPKDKPVQGLNSGTDYLCDNMNINKSISRKTKLMEVRSSQSIENKRDLNKNPMGSVPKYLDKRNKQIEQEYDTKLCQYKAMEEQTMGTEIQPLSEDELEVLRERLQTKLDNLVHIYQSRSHKRFFNSEWDTKRREELEKQIETLKAYLLKLYKPYVFVDHKNHNDKIPKLK